MKTIVELVKISWNEGHDTYLTQVKSDELVLKSFFEIDGWESIYAMSKAAALHSSFEHEDKAFVFKTVANKPSVEVYTKEGSYLLLEEDFLKMALYLFELLIAGANDNHHTIRYEPWWHAFTNYMFQIQEQLCCNES